jgi:hypothetical protein
MFGNDYDRQSEKNPKNCVGNKDFQDESHECNMQNDFFSFLTESGLACQGNEFKRFVSDQLICGCKPSSSSLCEYTSTGTCVICTAQDFANKDCDDCRSCLTQCEDTDDTKTTNCFLTADLIGNNIDKTNAFSACFDKISDSCRKQCTENCRKSG